MKNFFHKMQKFILNVFKIFSKKNKSFYRKIILLYFYAKVVGANFLQGRLLNLKSIKFLNFKVYFDSISELDMLVAEVFVDEPYYFKSEKSDPVIYDCGGNIGMSVLYFKHLYPNAKIKVFEPSPDVALLLKKNIEQNSLQNVSVHDVALSDSVGTINIFVREGMSLATTASVEERREGKEVPVEKKKLSEYINENIDVLKLDVQLSEGAVFEDLKNSSVIEKIKLVIMEYHYSFGVSNNNLSGILSFFEMNNFLYKIIFNAEKLDGFKTYIIRAYKKD